MEFLSTFIRRPVFALMINLAMVVTGVFAYTSLNIDIMPNMEFPVVTVTTTLEGAGPVEVEDQVTRPIEDAVAVVSGVDKITSTSQQGISNVVVEFKLDKDINVALAETRSKVDAIQNNFPTRTKHPILEKYSTTATAFMSIGVYGKYNLKELSSLVKQKVVDDLL